MAVFGTSAFGVFGSPNIVQSSPFGSAFGQMQSSFGIQPFGTTSQPASTSASTSAFRSTSAPVFRSTISTLDAGSVPACGVSSTPVFGASTTPAVGAPKTPLFGFGSTIAFGQLALSFGAASTPVFRSSPTFGSSLSPFDQSAAFGAQSTDASFGSQRFGQTSFGGHGGGSRVTLYSSTNEAQIVDGQATEKLISISSMPQYKDKSHEELRWEDYQLGDKGTSAFGVFGSPNIVQSSPFGSAFGQMQSSFGIQPFGTTSQPASTSASTSAFRSTSAPVFRSTISTLDAGSVPACGVSSTPVFEASTTTAVGAPKTPLFGFGSTIAFGQLALSFGAASTPVFRSSPTFGSSLSPFDQSAAFGAQSTDASFGSQRFGQTSFGGHGGGSRVTPYSSTNEAQIVDGQATEKLISISSMPQYKDKSHEELRWEDYQLGDKGASAFGQTTALGVFGSQSLGQSSPSGSTFGQKQPTFGNHPFGATSQPVSSGTNTSAFGFTTTLAFGTTTSALGATSVPAFGASSTPAFWTSSFPAFGASSTHPSGFGSTVTLGQPVMAFGAASTPAFGNSTPFGSTSSALGQNLSFGAQFTTPRFGSPGFGQTSFVGQCGGSRVTSYASTSETESGSCGEGPGKLISISAMPKYNVKSHEELRWEDYSVGDKGGPIPARQLPAGGSIFSPKSPDLELPKTWRGRRAKSLNRIRNKLEKTQENLGTFVFGQKSSVGELGSTSLAQSSPFGSTFCQMQPGFGRQPSVATIQPAFGATSTPAFGSTATTAFGSTTPAFDATSVPTIDAFSIPSSSTAAFVAVTTTSFGFGSNTTFYQSGPVFGAASTPSFAICTTFGSTLPFGQSSGFDS